MPASYHEVQHFLGLVEYISCFLPNISAYTTPLSGMCSDGLLFVWRNLQDKCFESIKAITSKRLSLKPINRTKQDPVWVVSNTCPSGCGAYFGQGEDWKTMRPTSFMSKKFTDAQCSYFTYEHETLGVIEALKKWDDVLLGLPEIKVMTDHQALKTFMQKAHVGPRQIRWSQWLTRFKIEFIHIPGKENRSADALSQIFENPNITPQTEDLSSVDLLLDKEGDDLPESRIKEKETLYLNMVTRAQEVVEPCVEESNVLTPQKGNENVNKISRCEVSNMTVAKSKAVNVPAPFVWKPEMDGENRPDLEKLCCEGYTCDKLFLKILQNPKDHKSFSVEKGTIYHTTDSETQVLCIPHSEFQGRKVTELVIDQVHHTVRHMGMCITKNYVHHYFWWPTLGTDIKLYCESCQTCQATKTSNKRLQGLLHSLPIPTKPWSSISMDFVGPFPLVILCRFTALVHLIPLRTMMTAAKLVPLFMSNIVQLHRLPKTIVSDRDPKFTSLFWTELHRLLGIKLARSTAFHPQTNGASERMIHKVSQVLRTLVRPDQLDWPKHLPTVEFAINSSINESTGFAPFELMYGYIPQMIQSVGKSQYAGVLDYAEYARDMIIQAHDVLIASRVEQMHYANSRCCIDEVKLEKGQKAYLSTENLNLPKARACKLMPSILDRMRSFPATRNSLIIHLPYQTNSSNVGYTPCSTLNYYNPPYPMTMPVSLIEKQHFSMTLGMTPNENGM